MHLTAITRTVSSSLANCELTWLPRVPIDAALAHQQHLAYELSLQDLGAAVLSLPALPDFPDSVFVEDPALILDEIAVITTMGCESRRGERPTLAEAIARFRPVLHMRPPGILEGGDVLRIDRDLHVGLSNRTDQAGIEELALILRPYGYRVHPVELRNCLHLKSAVSNIGDDTLLINRDWVDPAYFPGHRRIDVAPDEPSAANALRVNDTVIMPSAFPQTANKLRAAGFQVRELDLSELLKAESGVTCSSLLFQAP